MAIQGHSRSSISVSLKSHYGTADCIQYNTCGLVGLYESLEYVSSERSEKRRFRQPDPHVTPHNYPAKLRKDLHEPYLARN